MVKVSYIIGTRLVHETVPVHELHATRVRVQLAGGVLVHSSPVRS